MLGTIQRGVKVDVPIKQGEMYLLPPRIPHSPQRATKGSVGLVVERRRRPTELDCLRWYTNFDAPSTVSYESFFYCSDLGKDLVPVVEGRRAHLESGKTFVERTDKPYENDSFTVVPPPKKIDVDVSETIVAFSSSDFSVTLATNQTYDFGKSIGQIFCMQLKGTSVFRFDDDERTLRVRRVVSTHPKKDGLMKINIPKHSTLLIVETFSDVYDDSSTPNKKRKT